MSRKILIVSALAAITGLSACVQQGDFERGAVGAGLGCLVGEVIKDGKCAEGAILGGGAGVVSNRIR